MTEGNRYTYALGGRGVRMTVFKKRPFMYKLGAKLFSWMRDCALYEFSKANGTLVDVSAFKGEWKSEEYNRGSKNENNDIEM